MRIKIMISFLILFLGISSLTRAEKSEGYLILDTSSKQDSVNVNYIICSEPTPMECTKEKKSLAPAIPLGTAPTSISIPKEGVVRIISLTINNNRNYMYSDGNHSPCLLHKDEAITFKIYDTIATCSSEPVAVAQ